MAWLLFTIRTLPRTVLSKKFHIVRPIRTNMGKYCSLPLNTTVAINV